MQILKNSLKAFSFTKFIYRPISNTSLEEGKINDFRSVLCPQHKYIENYLKLRKYILFQKELTRLLNKNYYITLEFFNHIIREMVLNQQTEQAHQMLFVMKKFDYKPNDVTYSYLIEGYLTQENFQRAYSLLIEASLNNIVLDLEIYNYFLTQIKSQHYSFTSVLYQTMKQNFNPNILMIKKLFKLAYKFQNQGLLAKLEIDLNFLEFTDEKEGYLSSERRKLNEKHTKKNPYADNDKMEKFNIQVQDRSENNEYYRREAGRVLRHAPKNILKISKILPAAAFVTEYKDEDYKQSSDRSESSDQSDNQDEDSVDSEEDSSSYSPDIKNDSLPLKDSLEESDTEQLK